MLFAWLLTHGQACLCPKMEIPVQSPGRMAPGDARPFALAPVSKLAPGVAAHWKRDHRDGGMAGSNSVSPSAGKPYPGRWGFTSGVTAPFHLHVGKLAHCDHVLLLSNVLTLLATWECIIDLPVHTEYWWGDGKWSLLAEQTLNIRP